MPNRYPQRTSVTTPCHIAIAIGLITTSNICLPDTSLNIRHSSYWVTFSDLSNSTHQDGYLLHVPSGKYDTILNSEKHEGDIRISPDGTSISYSSSYPGEPWKTLKKAGITGREKELVPSALGVAFHSWAPDGKSVAYSSREYNGNWQIYIHQFDTGHTQQLTITGNNTHPSYSPDGNWILYVSDQDGDNDIFAIRPRDGYEIRLTQNEYYDDYPVWSPTGDSIIYASAGDPEGSPLRLGLYLLNDLGNLSHSPILLKNGAHGDYRHPDWSPNGEILIYTHTPNNDYAQTDYTNNSIKGSRANRSIEIMSVKNPHNTLTLLKGGYFDHPRWVTSSLSLGRHYFDLYASSFTALYRISGGATWRTSQKIGNFNISDMTDIALLDDQLLGISFDSLYEIDQDTAQTKLLHRFNIRGFNAFAVDKATGEMVISTIEGMVYRLAYGSWNLDLITSFGSGLLSAGDLAFDPKGKLYATAVNSHTGVEYLLKIDTKSGGVVRVGPIDATGTWGLGICRDGQPIALTNKGEVFALNPDTGAREPQQLIEPVTTSFTGAASFRSFLIADVEHPPTTTFSDTALLSGDPNGALKRPSTANISSNPNSNEVGAGSISYLTLFIGIQFFIRRWRYPDKLYSNTRANIKSFNSSL